MERLESVVHTGKMCSSAESVESGALEASARPMMGVAALNVTVMVGKTV